jgi:hypothetical protein
VLAGGSLTASTTVSGRISSVAGATIDFRLFGPNDATCSGAPVFSSLHVPYPATGSPAVTSSPPFAPTKAGTYRWTASYSGDTNNTQVDDGCNGPNQNVVVSGVTPTLTTNASSGVVLGAGSLTDTATVTGRVSPVAGATVDFKLYGPDDAACSGAPVFQSPPAAYPVGGGAVTSAAFAPAQTGTYRWVASYSGDANNVLVKGDCNAVGESVVVSRNRPSLATMPSAAIVLGTGSLTDDAAVTGRINPLPGAQIDFRLFGPIDATCAQPPAFRSLGVAYPVAGGTVTSPAFTPTKPGVYRWVASYGGDANNAPLTGACGDANATTVTPAPPGQPQPKRALPRRVTSTTNPKRDKTRFYRFTTTGRVVPPPNCLANAAAGSVGTGCVLPICPPDSTNPADCKRPSAAVLCAAGNVTVRFQRLVYTLSSRRVHLRKDCTFRSTVTIRTANPLRRGRLRVFTRFEGNPLLLPKKAPSHYVLAG